jgi:DNA-binding MarR family transcriptional regulator
MPFPDNHPFAAAFLANRLDRLADLIVAQGDELLRAADLSMPPRAVSLMLLIGSEKELSTADAASRLGQPHQLVTQRVELLKDLGLIERTEDPLDGRRKALTLSATGRDQYARLLECLSRASDGFLNLFEEIGCDLSSITAMAMQALQRKPLLDRVSATRGRSSKKLPPSRRTKK